MRLTRRVVILMVSLLRKPFSALQCLRLLFGLTAVRCPSNELLVGKRWPTVNPNAAAIIMDLQATAMVSQPARQHRHCQVARAQ